MSEIARVFDSIYSALDSASYRATVQEYSREDSMPDWVLPFSAVRGSELEKIATQLRLRAGDEFVDLGCGLGGAAIWVAERTGAAVIGVDISAHAVKQAQLLATRRELGERARFVAADMTQTGLPEGSFAGVMSVDAVLLADPVAVVAEMHRLLRPGGTVALTTFEPKEPPTDDPLEKWHVGDYGPYFREGGFRVEVHEEIAGWRDRASAFSAAVRAHADQLRAESGDIADMLIIESEKELTRPRVFIAATRL